MEGYKIKKPDIQKRQISHPDPVKLKKFNGQAKFLQYSDQFMHMFFFCFQTEKVIPKYAFFVQLSFEDENSYLKPGRKVATKKLLLKIVEYKKSYVTTESK